MTTLTSVRQNVDLAGKIFSAIWLRKPIIFNTYGFQNNTKFLQEIISYIPDYRQLVFYGNVPRSLGFNRFKLKIIKLEESEITKESLYQCFAEESISTPPLQIIYFNASEKDIEDLKQNIERGWIAFVNGEAAVYRQLAQQHRVLFFDLNDKEMPEERDEILSRNYIENDLFERIRETSQDAFLALLQKKMNEIRYIGKALIYEIESGKKLNQAEIQEIFEIDSRNFLNTLEILKVESGIDIRPYIQFIPEIISDVLKKIQKIAGVITVACLFNDKLLGINRGPDSTFFPLHTFLPFVEFYNQMILTFDEGDDQRLNIELSGGRTVLLFREDYLAEYRELIFILLMDSHCNAILTLKTIKTIFKEL
ncbi:hypothetical protein GF337_06010 [candidate division KSB1 bacterium]|nr:hypothetical protein [candidate division KSB1 bacterium]